VHAYTSKLFAYIVVLLLNWIQEKNFHIVYKCVIQCMMLHLHQIIPIINVIIKLAYGTPFIIQIMDGLESDMDF
jgi:hypothetical protein